MQYCISVIISNLLVGEVLFHVDALGAEYAIKCANDAPPSCFVISRAYFREASYDDEVACMLMVC
jgi:hypothetical protein